MNAKWEWLRPVCNGIGSSCSSMPKETLVHVCSLNSEFFSWPVNPNYRLRRKAVDGQGLAGSKKDLQAIQIALMAALTSGTCYSHRSSIASSHLPSPCSRIL